MNLVKLVGSGSSGSNISHSLDCNVYAVNCGDEYILIDAGSGLNPKAIEKNLLKEGIFPQKISFILLTHAHGDHAAGTFYFQKKYGIKVVASGEAAPWLEEGNREKTSINRAIKAGLYPENLIFEPIKVQRPVFEGDILKIGKLNFKVLETPGHSNGHVSYMCEEGGKRILFSGDSIFAGGKIAIQNIWDCSIQKYARTLETLNRYNIDILFPGHGPYVQIRAFDHIAKAHSIFEKLGIPPNII